MKETTTVFKVEITLITPGAYENRPTKEYFERVMGLWLLRDVDRIDVKDIKFFEREVE